MTCQRLTAKGKRGAVKLDRQRVGVGQGLLPRLLAEGRAVIGNGMKDACELARALPLAGGVFWPALAVSVTVKQPLWAQGPCYTQWTGPLDG